MINSGPSKFLKLFFLCVVVISVLSPSEADALLGENRTGGMSELYLDKTRIKIDGGYITQFENADIYVRAKGIEVSINVDNSASQEDRNLNFTVGNVNPETTKIIGWSEADIRKGKNSLAFTLKVKANKVAVYKITPGPLEGGFKFLVFGESRGGEDVFERILSDISYRKPLFAISCGDMLEDSTRGNFKSFIQKIDSTGIPFFTVVGSSEISNESRRLYEDYLGVTYHSFEYNKSHFIILDNADGQISEEQFQWLENDLIQNKADKTFVFMHLPVFDPRPGRKRPLEKGEQYRRLISLFETYKVTRVFSSGIHGYFRENRGGVTYIITGGGGSKLVSPDAFYNYVIVSVDDKVDDKLIKLKMPEPGWLEAAKIRIEHHVVNCFEVHPIRCTILTLIALVIFLMIIKGIYKKYFKRAKRRVTF